MDKNSNIKWTNDMFTKLVKEYGEAIQDITEPLENEICKSILNEEEYIDVLRKHSEKLLTNSKKKVKELDSVLSSSILPYGYDTGCLEYSKDSLLKNFYPTVILGEENLLDNDYSNKHKLTKYEVNMIKATSSGILKKVSKQIGKNILELAVDYLLWGPGLLQFSKLGNNIFSLIKENLDMTFVDKVGKFYNSDNKFKRAYDKTFKYLDKTKKHLHLVLNQAITDIDNKSYSTENVVIYKSVIALLNVLYSDYYKGIITREVIRTVKDGNKICLAIEKHLNDILQIKKIDSSTTDEDVLSAAAESYKTIFTLDESNPKNKYISILFSVISSAIATYYMTNSYSTPEEKNKVEKLKELILSNSESIISVNPELTNPTDNTSINIAIKLNIENIRQKIKNPSINLTTDTYIQITPNILTNIKELNNEIVKIKNINQLNDYLTKFENIKMENLDEIFKEFFENKLNVVETQPIP